MSPFLTLVLGLLGLVAAQPVHHQAEEKEEVLDYLGGSGSGGGTFDSDWVRTCTLSQLC